MFSNSRSCFLYYSIRYIPVCFYLNSSSHQSLMCKWRRSNNWTHYPTKIPTLSVSPAGRGPRNVLFVEAVMDRRVWEDLELPALPIVALQLVTADRELVEIIYFLAIKSLKWLISLEHVDKAPNWQVQSMGCSFNLGRAGGGGAEAQQIDGPLSSSLSHRSGPGCWSAWRLFTPTWLPWEGRTTALSLHWLMKLSQT